MSGRVLHVLSQRPSHTGSGTTIDAIVRCAQRSGWQQDVIVGVPRDDPRPDIAELPAERVHPLVFGERPLDFRIPGMSDVMPYPSSRFRSLNSAQIAAYCASWQAHVAKVVEATRPDLIHSHHIWLLSALLKDVAPRVPVVTHCHGTGLRQLEHCRHLAAGVTRGCARNDHFLSLHAAQSQELADVLGIARARITKVGGGYREEIFHSHNRAEDPGTSLIYAGKLSAAKGLPWLLDAVERMRVRNPNILLHVVGSGAGDAADALRDRMSQIAPNVQAHGQRSPAELSQLMRQSAVFVLPSFYEGLGLVLVESVACGCRVVCTRLAGIERELAPRIAAALEFVAPPRMHDVDRPFTEDLPAFVDRLETGIVAALNKPPVPDPFRLVSSFTWDAVFRQVESVWQDLIEKGQSFCRS